MEPRNPDDLEALRAASDVLGIDALLTGDERAVRDQVRGFVDARIVGGRHRTWRSLGSTKRLKKSWTRSSARVGSAVSRRATR